MNRQPQREAAGFSSSNRLGAPVAGWNTRDSYATMGPQFAIFLDNLYPYQNSCMLRKGAEEFAALTVTTEHLQSVIPYNPKTGTQRLFVASEAGLYEATAGGTLSVVASAATNAQWQFTSATNFVGTSYIFLANGVDKARIFDGTSWVVLDTASSPALTGVTSTSVINVSLFKSRIYLTCINSLSFWYLAVNAIAGAAVEFPLAGVFKRGGYLVGTDSWTVDGGNGPDDYFVAVSSEGEVVVYQGYDPSTAQTWGLVGLYQIAKPIGRRCFTRLGSDLLILTKTGVVPLSKLLQSGDLSTRNPVTDTIAQAFQGYADSYSTEYGWQMTLFLDWDMLIANVPIGFRRSVQCVMNTKTGAWCRFTGWDSEAWGLFNSVPYFVRNYKVYKAWSGTDDFNKAIVPAVKTSFNYFKQNGRSRQHVKLVRLVGEANASIPVQMGLATDFAEGEYTGSFTTFSQVVARWDQAIWDQSTWPSTSSTSSNWRTVASIPGRSTALLWRASLKGVSTFKWYASDAISAGGGML